MKIVKVIYNDLERRHDILLWINRCAVKLILFLGMGLLVACGAEVETQSSAVLPTGMGGATSLPTNLAMTPTLQPTLPPTNTPPPGSVVIAADHPAIKYYGRFDFTNPQQPRFDWPGASIEIRFTGSAISLLLEDTSNWYNVYLDDLSFVLPTVYGQDNYLLAANLEEGNHFLRITKRTEAGVGLGTFKGIALPSTSQLLDPAPDAGRKIEFIGDSITTGYGSEGRSATCDFTARTQNVEQTYAAQTARELGTEVMITAKSGMGMVRNYGDVNTTSVETMATLYGRSIAQEKNSVWDFSRWQPNVVVVNLGTNDFSTQPHPPQETFVTGYVAFLQTVRNNYPQAHIFAMAGPLMQSPATVYIETAVSRMNDPNVHFVPIENTLSYETDYGCDWHPNETGQSKIAGQLIPVIREVMGW